MPNLIRYQEIPGSLAISFLQSLFTVTNTNGLTQSDVLAAAGISIDDASENQRISGNKYCHLLDVAADMSQDSDFGLHVGEAIKPGHYGVLGYACMSSINFEEIFYRVQRYQYLVSDIGSSTICCLNSKHDNIIKFKFECKVLPYPPRQLAEEHLAGVVTFGRWICGIDRAPLKVHFQHSEPQNIAEHLRIFSCPVLFNQDETALYFPISYIVDKLPQADPVVSQMMDSYAEEQLVKLPIGGELINQVGAAVATLLQNGEPSLENLAKYIQVSQRSLQRKLKEEQLSYQSLLDKIRHQLSLVYIQQKQLSLTDIAFLLGFSEQSSFQRAFKRWTGQTPGRHRRNSYNANHNK